MRIPVNGPLARAVGVICLCVPLAAGCCTIESIRTESLPGARVGTPYSFELEHNCSGKSSAESEDWRLATGAVVPPGLSLARDGRFSGTPIAAGTYSFAVELGASDLTTFEIKDVRTFSIIVGAESAGLSPHLPVATIIGRSTSGCTS
jgi:hypothetical protein